MKYYPDGKIRSYVERLREISRRSMKAGEYDRGVNLALVSRDIADWLARGRPQKASVNLHAWLTMLLEEGWAGRQTTPLTGSVPGETPAIASGPDTAAEPWPAAGGTASTYLDEEIDDAAVPGAGTLDRPPRELEPLAVVGSAADEDLLAGVAEPGTRTGRSRTDLLYGVGIVVVLLLALAVSRIDAPGWLAGRLGPGPSPVAKQAVSPSPGRSPSPTAAVTATPMVTLTPAAAGLATSSAVASSSPTAVAAPTATPTAPAAIAFPGTGDEFPVFPWQVVVTGTLPMSVSLALEPVAPFTRPITVTLAGRPVGLSNTLVMTSAQSLVPEGAGYVYRWTRGVNDLKDLPSGEYRLIASRSVPTSPQPWTQTATIKIVDTLAVSATVDSTDGIGVRVRPVEKADRQGYNVPEGQTVRVLGQVRYLDANGNLTSANSYNLPDQWCFLEARDGRRGWIWCVLLDPASRVNSVPAIAPPLVGSP